jgi:hypothetical protein
MGQPEIGFVVLDGEPIQPYRLKDCDGVVLLEYADGQYMAQRIPNFGMIVPKDEK